MAKTVHGSLEEHLGNQAALWGSIGTEVNGGKWHLSAGAAMHSVEVMYEAFHGLKRLMLSILMGIANYNFWHLCLLELFVIAKGNIVFNFNL